MYVMLKMVSIGGFYRIGLSPSYLTELAAINRSLCVRPAEVDSEWEMIVYRDIGRSFLSSEVQELR